MKRKPPSCRRTPSDHAAWIALALSACGAPAKSATALAQQATQPSAPAVAISQCVADSPAYQPQPASSEEVHLPRPPELPQRAIKAGDAFTVWGAGYFLRSRVHHAEVANTKLTVEGYIVKTNLADAPSCAVHPAGRADKENCHAAIPTFWIGDTPDASPKNSIQVMGWASNYAQIYDAIRSFDAPKASAEYTDTFWGVKLPNPLPARGAKVRVSGNYGSTFAMASSGAVADPFMGILTYEALHYAVPAPELASLPGVRRRPASKP